MLSRDRLLGPSQTQSLLERKYQPTAELLGYSTTTFQVGPSRRLGEEPTCRPSEWWGIFKAKKAVTDSSRGTRKLSGPDRVMLELFEVIHRYDPIEEEAYIEVNPILGAFEYSELQVRWALLGDAFKDRMEEEEER